MVPAGLPEDSIADRFPKVKGRERGEREDRQRVVVSRPSALPSSPPLSFFALLKPFT